MFIIVGTKVVTKLARNGLSLRRHCARCHLLSDLREHVTRQYFAFFFIPIIPLSKGESVLICSRCGASFYPQAEDYLSAQGGEPRVRPDAPAQEKTVINCAYCRGPLRLPVLAGRKLLVTCPHCKQKFDVQA